MKKLLLLTSIFLFVGILKPAAQITLTQSDLASIGDTIRIARDTFPGNILLGGIGLQSWDFSSLQVDILEENAFVTPSSTFAGNDFPNSNIAMDVNNGTQINYGTISSSAYMMDGFWGDPIGSGMPVSIKFNPSSKKLVFPSTLNTSFQDTSSFDFRYSDPGLASFNIDSVKIAHTSYTTKVFDAYGQMITPTDTFDCIRQYSMEVSFDTIYVKWSIGGGWMIIPPSFFPPEFGIDSNPSMDTIISYYWYANGEGIPVAEATVDPVTNEVLTASFIVKDKVVAGLFAAVNPSCKGICDGNAMVNAVSGYSPYTYQWDAAAGSQTENLADSLCAGTYTVTITDALGNKASATVSLTEISYYSTFTPAQCDTCPDGSATIVASNGYPPYGFLWETGENTGTLSNVVPGTYTVTITDNNNCTLVDSVSIWTVGLEEKAAGSSLHIFPNPSSGKFEIRTDNGNQKILTIYNMLGKAVYSLSSEQETIDIDLSAIDDGVYVLKIESENAGAVQRIIISR